MNLRALLRALCLLPLVSGCAIGRQAEYGAVAFDVSPDSRQIVFSAVDGDLYLLDRHTLRVKRLTHSPDAKSAPCFSPDGKEIAYSSRVSGRSGAALSVLSLASRTAHPLTTGTSDSDHAPAYSSDGQKIVFARAQRYREYSMGGMIWNDYDVFVMNANGTGAKQLTHRKYYQLHRPHFSHDGSQVLYAADEPFDTKFFKKEDGGSLTTILRVSSGGTGEPRLVLPLPAVDPRIGALGTDPDPSPNGKQIAYISDRGSPYQYDVCTMRPDGSDIRQLRVNKISHYNQQPTYLPDGSGILFLAGTGTGAGNRPIFSLWQVDADGRRPHEIAGSELFADPLHWKPKR